MNFVLVSVACNLSCCARRAFASSCVVGCWDQCSCVLIVVNERYCATNMGVMIVGAGRFFSVSACCSCLSVYFDILLKCAVNASLYCLALLGDSLYWLISCSIFCLVIRFFFVAGGVCGSVGGAFRFCGFALILIISSRSS